MARKILLCGAGLMIFISALSAARGAKLVKSFAPDGPYKVGVMIANLKLDGRETKAAIWYPAGLSSGAAAYRYAENFEGHAVRDADLDKSGAPYPLVMFSHGMGGCGCQSVFYNENLASFGYIVIAPDHKDSAMCHIDAPPDITFGQIAWATIKSGGNLGPTVYALFKDKIAESDFDRIYRPREASETMDYALALNQDQNSKLYKTIDPEKIGVTGHSFGGFTTLAVGGLPLHCEGLKPEAGECSKEGREPKARMNPCCQVQDFSDPFFMRDSRVKAILPLGAAAFFPDLERSASEVTIPVMMINGDSKRMETPWEPVWIIYQNLKVPKYAVRLKKTDHMAIGDMTLAANPTLVKLFLPGFRSGYQEKAQAYKDYSVAFFNKYLKGDNSRAETLHGPVNKYVEFWYEEP